MVNGDRQWEERWGGHQLWWITENTVNDSCSCPKWQLQWARMNSGWPTCPSLPGPFLALALNVPCPRNRTPPAPNPGQTRMLFTLHETEQGVAFWGDEKGIRATQMTDYRKYKPKCTTKTGDTTLESKRCVLCGSSWWRNWTIMLVEAILNLKSNGNMVAQRHHLKKKESVAIDRNRRNPWAVVWQTGTPQSFPLPHSNLCK